MLADGEPVRVSAAVWRLHEPDCPGLARFDRCCPLRWEACVDDLDGRELTRTFTTSTAAVAWVMRREARRDAALRRRALEVVAQRKQVIAEQNRERNREATHVRRCEAQKARQARRRAAEAAT